MSLSPAARSCRGRETTKCQVEHALTRLFSDVGDHAEAVHALFLCDLGDDLEAVRNDGAVRLVYRCNRLDVLLRDNEEVGRRLRVSIVECVADIVLVDLARRDFRPPRFLQNRQSSRYIAPFEWGGAVCPRRHEPAYSMRQRYCLPPLTLLPELLRDSCRLPLRCPDGRRRRHGDLRDFVDLARVCLTLTASAPADAETELTFTRR